MADHPESFEEALVEVEAVLRSLEDGDTGLEQALALYERGVGLLKHCYGQLSAAEQRILKLTGVDAAGQPVLEPFAHTATVDPPAKRRRGPRDD